MRTKVVFHVHVSFALFKTGLVIKSSASVRSKITQDLCLSFALVSTEFESVAALFASQWELKTFLHLPKMLSESK